MAARGDFIDQPPGIVEEGSQAVWLIWVQNVHQVMRHAAPLLDRRLCRSDVEAAVKEPRIGVYDLAAKAVRDLDSKVRLARGRGSNNRDKPFH